jgi:hypothetical protein
MKALKRIFEEVWGLFVDDGAYAGAIVGWLVVIGLVVKFAPGAAAWAGFALFAGLAAILLESAVRRSRK